jgi:predicted negative regulator of RcsB-dependent stress response
MEQSIENKTELKTKLLNFYNSNKVKIYFLIFIIILILISFTFIKYKNEKNNTIVAEKYIEAGLNLTSNQKDKAKKIYEEIIYSKNNFYSILALNTILEKNLISDNDKILEYFEILEKSSSLKSQKDLITLKKALYLIKENDTQKGNNLLKELIENKSSLEPIAQEILDK